MPKVFVLCTLYFSLQLICTFPVVSQSTIYRFDHLTIQDGIPSTAIYSIMQDSYGFMWIATRNGLCRYDGYEIKVYQYNPDDSTSISGNFIQSRLLEDDESNIWVGTLANGLNRYNRKTETFTRYLHDPEDSTSLSYNSVWSLFQDKQGVIWIGTTGRDYSPGGGGLNRYNKSEDNFTAFYPDPDLSESEKNRINVINEDNGLLWVGTRDGMFTFDRIDHKFTLFEPTYENSELFSVANFQSMTIDGDSIYWIGTRKGLFKYYKKNQRLEKICSGIPGPYQLGGTEFRNKMILDPFEEERIFWIGSDYGLHKYNPSTGKVNSFLKEMNNPEGLISNFVSGLVLDDADRLWISGYPGINIINLKSRFYKNYDITFPGDDFKYSAITFYEDSLGYFWVGTSRGGLIKYNHQMNQVAHYPEFTSYNNYINTIVRELYVDSRNNVWIGCSGSGLHILDRQADRPVPCKFDEVSPYPPLVITAICEDHNNRLWIGSRIGLFVRDTKSDDPISFVYAPFEPANRYRIESIYEDSQHRLWVGTFGDGLLCLSTTEKDSGDFVNWRHDSNDPHSIPSNEVIGICEDMDGNVWFGTSRGLCKYDETNDRFERVSLKEDVDIDVIYFLLCDKNGDFWTPSEKGLIRFDPRGLKRTKLFSEKDGPPIDLINYFNLYESPAGDIYVGGFPNSGHGFYSFHPDSILANQHIPSIVITDFQIRYKPVNLDSSISFKRKIKLKYNQNYFSFEFAALDLTDPKMNQYAYFLERFDEDWIYSGNRRFANYTGVPPGTYTFRVKGSNNDGLWNEEGTSILIIITPPFWKTWWAYTIYGLLLISLLYGWRRYDLKRQRLKQDLELEHVQTEKLEELDRLKSRFFANISHEFRTPLTLILGPLEGLLKRITDNKSQQDLGIMKRNALRLQRLINQLLSLSKLESGKMKLQAEEMDVIPLVKGYIQSFESLAKQKGIDLVFKVAVTETAAVAVVAEEKAAVAVAAMDEIGIPVYVDRDKIEKILYNLLSNAFKFTAEGGRIEVQVDKISQVTYHISHITSLLISISDTGPGIPSEKLPHIFDRFYQADDSYTKDQEGTGIGLALTKELVELHHGKITVKSEVGKGTTFTVFLPLGKEHLKLEEIRETGDRRQEAGNKETVNLEPETLNFEPGTLNFEPGTLNFEPGTLNGNPIILIVEDNADLRLYIRGYLDQTYNVIEAENGRQGLDLALDHMPDLIISDVMMPLMDGFELCGKLKTDQRTSHIPVILLTARAGMESKIEGLETGADDFITKPFDPLELQTRVRNLIRQRQLLREAFGSEIRKGELSLIKNISLSGLAEMDHAFIKKAYDVVEHYLADPEFNVEVFGQEMAISRVHLHRKLKALINHTATEFIRTLRLNKAAGMLARKSATISEIAYDVGFNTVPYFTKCFQEHFGMTPSAYSKHHG